MGRHQQQSRPVLARHLLQLPVLVVIKVCVPPVAGEEGVSSLSARTIKARPVTVVASLEPGGGRGINTDLSGISPLPDVDVNLPRFLLGELQVCCL